MPNLRQGDRIKIFVKDRGVEKPSPVMATVLTIQRGAITVHEADSINGLAQIVIHGMSGNDGTYWYEYRSREGEGTSKDVTDLYVEGQQLKVADFILE